MFNKNELKGCATVINSLMTSAVMLQEDNLKNADVVSFNSISPLNLYLVCTLPDC